jgi:hypothetical protein
MRALFYVSEHKTVERTRDGKLLGNTDTLFFELEARGYSPRQMIDAITSVQDRLGLNDDLDKAVGRDPKWRKFEKIIAGIHKFAEMGPESYGTTILQERSQNAGGRSMSAFGSHMASPSTY